MSLDALKETGGRRRYRNREEKNVRCENCGEWRAPEELAKYEGQFRCGPCRGGIVETT